MPEFLANTLASFSEHGAQIVGIWVAALLTLAILSYVFGYNGAFRLAEHLFVGVAAGYAAAVAWNSVLWPRLVRLWQAPASYWHYALFFGMGLLLLARRVRRLSPLANLPLAVLIGTGAGLALGGALLGSLLPQTRAAIVSVSPRHYGGGISGWARAVNALLLILGTMASLAMFTYRQGGQGRLGRLSAAFWRGVGSAGRKIVMIAFGALLAGAAITFFTVLQSRLDFLVSEWLPSFSLLRW